MAGMSGVGGSGAIKSDGNRAKKSKDNAIKIMGGNDTQRGMDKLLESLATDGLVTRRVKEIEKRSQSPTSVNEFEYAPPSESSSMLRIGGQRVAPESTQGASGVEQQGPSFSDNVRGKLKNLKQQMFQAMAVALREPSVNLPQLMTTDEGRKGVKDKLDSQYNSELYDSYVEIEKMEGQSDGDMLVSFKSFSEKFVAEGSLQEVNLSGEDRSALMGLAKDSGYESYVDQARETPEVEGQAKHFANLKPETSKTFGRARNAAVRSLQNAKNKYKGEPKKKGWSVRGVLVGGLKGLGGVLAAAVALPLALVGGIVGGMGYGAARSFGTKISFFEAIGESINTMRHAGKDKATEGEKKEVQLGGSKTDLYGDVKRFCDAQDLPITDKAEIAFLENVFQRTFEAGLAKESKEGKSFETKLGAGDTESTLTNKTGSAFASSGTHKASAGGVGTHAQIGVSCRKDGAVNWSAHRHGVLFSKPSPESQMIQLGQGTEAVTVSIDMCNGEALKAYVDTLSGDEMGAPKKAYIDKQCEKKGIQGVSDDQLQQIVAEAEFLGDLANETKSLYGEDSSKYKSLVGLGQEGASSPALGEFGIDIKQAVKDSEHLKALKLLISDIKNRPADQEVKNITLMNTHLVTPMTDGGHMPMDDGKYLKHMHDAMRGLEGDGLTDEDKAMLSATTGRGCGELTVDSELFNFGVNQGAGLADTGSRNAKALEKTNLRLTRIVEGKDSDVEGAVKTCLSKVKQMVDRPGVSHNRYLAPLLLQVADAVAEDPSSMRSFGCKSGKDRTGVLGCQTQLFLTMLNDTSRYSSLGANKQERVTKLIDVFEEISKLENGSQVPNGPNQSIIESAQKDFQSIMNETGVEDLQTLTQGAPGTKILGNTIEKTLKNFLGKPHTASASWMRMAHICSG